MPYKDAEKQREAKRESARTRRAVERGTVVDPAIPAPLRLRTALDVLELIGEEVGRVKADTRLETVERARTVGYLASVALRAVEQANLAERVEVIERSLSARPRSENGRHA